MPQIKARSIVQARPSRMLGVDVTVKACESFHLQLRPVTLYYSVFWEAFHPAVGSKDSLPVVG